VYYCTNFIINKYRQYWHHPSVFISHCAIATYVTVTVTTDWPKMQDQILTDNQNRRTGQWRTRMQMRENGSALILLPRDTQVIVNLYSAFMWSHPKCAQIDLPPVDYNCLRHYVSLTVAHEDPACPVIYALMSHKTQALHEAVFAKIKDPTAQFAPLCATADLDEATVSVSVAGCWVSLNPAIVEQAR